MRIGKAVMRWMRKSTSTAILTWEGFDESDEEDEVNGVKISTGPSQMESTDMPAAIILDIGC